MSRSRPSPVMRSYARSGAHSRLSAQTRPVACGVKAAGSRPGTEEGVPAQAVVVLEVAVGIGRAGPAVLDELPEGVFVHAVEHARGV